MGVFIPKSSDWNFFRENSVEYLTWLATTMEAEINHYDDDSKVETLYFEKGTKVHFEGDAEKMKIIFDPKCGLTKREKSDQS